MQGLVFRLMRRTGWTLTRKAIPPRPAVIEPYTAGRVKLDPTEPMLMVTGLQKRFGSLVVATDLNLQVYPYRLHETRIGFSVRATGGDPLFGLQKGDFQRRASRTVRNR